MPLSENLMIASEIAATSNEKPSAPLRVVHSSSPQTSSLDSAAASRKLTLLKRLGLFGQDTKGAKIERACTAEDLRGAYQLVHQVYFESGYIKPEPSGMRLRIFETSSETATFVAKVQGEVVGVISVVADSIDLGLPSDAAFSTELDTLRDTGIRICEVTNQVVAEEYRKSAVTTELMRCAVAHAIKSGCRIGVATVSPSHNGFYDLLGFNQLGSERSYSQKLHDPVVALTIDFNNFRNPPDYLVPAVHYTHTFLGPTNTYLKRVAVWDRAARANFLNPQLLEQLFVKESDFLAQCSPAELETVRLRWGQELFRAVVGSLPVDDEPDFEDSNFVAHAPVFSDSAAFGSEAPFNKSSESGYSKQVRYARRASWAYLFGVSAHSSSERPPTKWWRSFRGLVAADPAQRYVCSH